MTLKNFFSNIIPGKDIPQTQSAAEKGKKKLAEVSASATIIKSETTTLAEVTAKAAAPSSTAASPEASLKVSDSKALAAESAASPSATPSASSEPAAEAKNSDDAEISTEAAAALESSLLSSQNSAAGGSSTSPQGGSKPILVGSPGSPDVDGAKDGKVDVDDVISRLMGIRNTKPSKSLVVKNHEIMQICYRVREVFLEQSCLLELNPPVNIVGDIHGQFDDLLRIFDILGYPPQSNYLFLGDYVDRGKQSLETILLLLCYKIKYPENFFILRGNHECASVNRVYGFYDECKRRCSLKIWKVFTDVFNCLPIAALVAGKIFCVHGGLSPSLNVMDDIRLVQRPTDVPDFGLLNDLLWSDPSDAAVEWEDNERGVSYCFGKGVLQDFLSKHEFDLVARAHMVVEDGYEFFADRTLVTIFSAPNYCGEFDNKGAVMSVNDDLLCSFELLQPQTGVKLGLKKRRNSPPSVK